MNPTAASSPDAPRLMPRPTARRSLRTLFAATVTELLRRERRLALFGFVVTFASVLVGADFPADIGGLISRCILSLKAALLSAAFLWLLYLALEPYIRRNRPHLIGSWSRLLAGELRDPAGVAADILVHERSGKLFTEPIADLRTLGP